MRRMLATAAATGLTALALLAGPGIAGADPDQPATDQNSRLLNDNVIGVSVISVVVDNVLNFEDSVVING
ncbi:hypothetical protein [Saccharothrix sp.]|uniref:hypothetical protein n=1 Tax=Saccharothrix sp. TaxID=1873460 RepID=UPI0028126312|nr:hypothetical protein [Saccharothrix sp.]